MEIPNELIEKVALAVAQATEESELWLCVPEEECGRTVAAGDPGPEQLSRFTRALIQGLMREGVLDRETLERYSLEEEPLYDQPASPQSVRSFLACTQDVEWVEKDVRSLSTDPDTGETIIVTRRDMVPKFRSVRSKSSPLPIASGPVPSAEPEGSPD